jgi:cytochrome d ubiquinol oxidase subunit I
MVGLGTWFIVLFSMILYLTMTDELHKHRWLLWAGVWSLPMGYVAQEAGWITAEVGRLPWAIQDMLPVSMATSTIQSGAVMVTVFLFAILFTALLIAEVKIMMTQIKMGPKEDSHV